MNLKWPYKLLLAAILLLSTAFAASPFIAMHDLANAVKENNTEQWQARVKNSTFNEYTRKLLDGLLRARLSLEMQSKNISTVTAMQDYTFAQSAIDRQSRKIVTTKGLHTCCVPKWPGFLNILPNMTADVGH